jgi:hypothetical protein
MLGIDVDDVEDRDDGVAVGAGLRVGGGGPFASKEL